MSPAPAAALPLRARLELALQRGVAHALAPLWVPGVVAVLRFALGYRIEGLRELRREYRAIRREVRAPLLLCANHLTMIDSFLIGWALGSPGFYLTHFASLPWNLPEQRNFAATRASRAATWVLKGLPIQRGGPRGDVARVLGRFTYLLSRGEVGLVFPEGGRSRTGRVDPETAAYGVGRVVRSLPGCRVLCVYLRGEHQDDWSGLPARGERFRASLRWAEPKSEHAGLRGSREVAQQIAGCLAEMERDHFDGR